MLNIDYNSMFYLTITIIRVMWYIDVCIKWKSTRKRLVIWKIFLKNLWQKMKTSRKTTISGYWIIKLQKQVFFLNWPIESSRRCWLLSFTTCLWPWSCHQLNMVIQPSLPKHLLCVGPVLGTQRGRRYKSHQQEATCSEDSHIL